MTDERELDRREFLKATSAMGVGAMAASHGLAPLLSRGASPNEKVVVGVIGVNGRGVVHAQNFATLENSEVAYICDVDANVVAKAVTAASKGQKNAPKVIGDFRRVLDDKSVDAISNASLPSSAGAPSVTGTSPAFVTVSGSCDSTFTSTSPKSITS